MPAVITRQRSLPVLLEVEGGNVGEIRIRDQPRAVLVASKQTNHSQPFVRVIIATFLEHKQACPRVGDMYGCRQNRLVWLFRYQECTEFIITK